MKRKERTKTFVMVSTWKTPFGLHVYTVNIFQRCKGLWAANTDSGLTWMIVSPLSIAQPLTESRTQSPWRIGTNPALSRASTPSQSSRVTSPSAHCQLPHGYNTIILYAYDIVGKARWAHLSTCHHIKPEPLGKGLMWWQLSAKISPSCRTKDAVSIYSYEYLSEITLCSEAYRRRCEMGWSHYTCRSESQKHECEKLIYHTVC